MPRIPAAENRVSLGAAPLVQRRQADVSSGLRAVGGALELGAERIHAIRKEEQQRVDRTAFMEADRITDSAANELWGKAEETTLKDAVGISPKLLEEFDKRTSEIERGLTSDRQKLVYRESVNSKRAQLESRFSAHERAQSRAFDAKVADDYMDQQHSNAAAAYDDPAAIESSIANMASALRNKAGYDDSMRDAELGVRRSAAYGGVIERYLANDRIADADKYYQSIKGKVNGDRAARIENVINDAKRQAEARAKAGAAEAREAIRDDLQDAFRWRPLGKSAELPSQARFVAAYGADGKKRYDEAAQLMQAHDVAAEVAFLPPTEAAAKLAEMLPTGQSGASSKMDAYEMGVKIAMQQRAKLEADPAAGILASDPQMMTAARLMSENPGSEYAAETYFRAMAAKQQTIGIEKPKLLTDGHAAAMADALTFNPEKPEARAQAMAQLSAAYGKWMPAVLQQVAPQLDGHARVVVNMAEGPAVRLDAARVNQQDIEKSTSTSSSEIKAIVDSGITHFAHSLGDQPDAGARVEEHRSAVELLARSYVLRGSSPSAAVEKAFGEVLGRYKYVEQGNAPMLRIPDGVDENEVRFATYRLRAAATDGKTEFKIKESNTSTPEQAQRDMISTIKRQGYWIPNEKESGVILRIPHDNGTGDVYRKDGSRVEYTWDQFLDKPTISDLKLY